MWKKKVVVSFKVLLKNFLAKIRENGEKPQSEWPETRLSFEHGTFRIRNRRSKPSTVKLVRVEKTGRGKQK
jgi:hypothetical protein